MIHRIEAAPGGQLCYFGIASGRSIGPEPDLGKPHLGYWLGTPCWGQGYATEAARALIDAFFVYGDEDELTASARVINPGSRRVLEKCGFAYQGSGLVELRARGGLFPVDHFRLDRKSTGNTQSLLLSAG